MVTPAMQQQPQVIYGPNGERAEWNGREYVVAPSAAPRPAAGGGGYQLQPMVTPAEQRAREEREYDRQRDAERDDRLDRNEERQVETQARLARTEERAIAATELTNRGGTPELRGRLALGLGPSVRAVDSMAAQHEGVNPLNRDWGATLIDSIPDFGLLSAGAKLVGGQDYQDYNQSLKTVESSLLPIFSGMAVTPTEAQRFMKANQPQLGDSPETIQRKTQNVQIILNEGAFLAGREIPYPAAGRYGEDGFRELIASGDVSDVTAPRIGAASTPGGGEGPQPGDVRVTQQPLAPTDSPNSLSAQGYVYDPGRDIWTRSSQQEVSPQETRQASGADRTAQGEGIGRKVDAAVRGAADTLTFGASDEIVAGLNTVLPLDRGSQSLWTEGAGDAYAHNLAMQRGIDQADARDVPVSRGVGQVAGGLVPGVGVARAAVGGTRIVRAARGARAGAAYGGAYGFGSGEGNATERLPGAATGAGIGAAGGTASPFVANAISRGAAPVVNAAASGARAVARPFVNALGDSAPIALREAVQPNALASGIDRFADRMGETRVNALNPRVASQRELGMEPTLIDALDDASVGRARALATRDTPARDSAVRFAERRRNNLPSRTARIAREEISADTRPAMDILDAQRTTRRDNASTIQTFGGDPVPVSEDLVAALRSDFVKPHLQAAAQRAQGALNPADREASARLAQIADTALDNPNGVSLTVRDAQDVSKALNDAAQAAFRNGSPDGPVLRDLANAIRGSARDNSDGYAAWLQKYGEDSDLMEAATTGRNFVSVSNDPVNARSTEAFVRGAEGASDAGREIMRATSREAVEVAASNPSSARSTLDRFASDTDQARRAQALGVDAGRLRDRSQAEIDAVTAAQRASPRVGSESSTNLQDAGDAAGGIIGAIRRPISAAFGAVMNRVASRGFSDAQAEAIVTAAQDPARTDDLIGMLAQRMNRRDARNLARALRYQITTGLQSGQQN